MKSLHAIVINFIQYLDSLCLNTKEKYFCKKYIEIIITEISARTI